MYQMTTLSNGLRVASEFLPGVESVAVAVSCGVGARYEHEGENGISHLDADLWSDMWALMDIREIMPYFSKQTVMEATKLLTGKPWTEAECKILDGKDAIHFSHNSLVTGVKREGETFKDRPKIATKILHLIEKKCLGRDGQIAS